MATQTSQLAQQNDYQAFELVNDSEKADLYQRYGDALVDAYPASQLQMGMLLESNLDATTYHDVLEIAFEQPYDRERLQQTLQQWSDSHEALRTAFVEHANHGYLAAVVAKQCPVLLEQVDECWQDEQTRPFELANPGLFRFMLTETNEQGFKLCFSFHHAIVDGWSVATLLGDLLSRYYGESINHSAAPGYGEFVKKECWAGNDPDHQRFWQSHLSGYEPPQWSFVKPSADRVDSHIQTMTQPLPAGQSAALLELASTWGLSVDNLFAAMFHQVLCHFENSRDITLGMVANNRLETVGGDSVPGLFLNTLPFRPSQATGPESARQKVMRFAREKNQAFIYKAYPYAKIQQEHGSNAALYHYAFNYTHFATAHNATGLAAEAGGLEKTNIPLVFNVARQPSQMVMSFYYHRHLVDRFMVEQLMHYMQAALTQLTDSPDQPIKRLTERDLALMADAQSQSNPVKCDETILQRFEQQVSNRPEQTAIYGKTGELSYRLLDLKANRLAHRLRQQQVKHGDVVAICLNRTPEFAVAVLAIMKLGAAYLPLSPKHPLDRIAYVLEDSGAHVLITSEAQKPDYSTIEHQVELVCVDASDLVHMPGHKPPVESSSQDLAYVLYTSGTTGKPKGAMLSHANVVHFVDAQFMLYQDANLARGLMFAEFVFDVSTFDLFYGLLCGQTLYLTNEAQRHDPQQLAEVIEQQNIDWVMLPPAMLELLPEQAFGRVKAVMTGGEAPSKDALERFSRYCNIYNVYGPTETTVWVTTHLYRPGDGAANIGRVIGNNKLWVLSEEGEQVPMGTTGELCVSGDSVGMGYLNRPELTARQFVEHPGLNCRIYRTGDMVRQMPDGSLRFQSRRDGQIKIRGFRIEIGEVEHALQNLPGIKQATVMATDGNGGKQLVAYLVAEPDAIKPDPAVLLANQLPGYMVPSSFTWLDAIPLTINGKVDYRALPKPAPFSKTQSLDSLSEAQAKLHQLWQQQLGHDQFGIDDAFLDIGGNSITAIKLIQQINQTFNCQLPVSTLFSNGTINGLSTSIRAHNTSLVKPLNHLTGKPKRFMIHGAACGGEVFASLATKQNEQFDCYGIDNLNMIEGAQTGDLKSIAKRYFKEVNQILQADEPVNLLGWSMGGFIALEVAGYFEQQGKTDIRLSLIDTFINPDMSDFNFDQWLQEQGHDGQYISQIKTALTFEKQIIASRLSAKLKHTKVTLYSAGDKDLERTRAVAACSNGEFEEVNLPQTNHFNILQQLPLQ